MRSTIRICSVAALLLTTSIPAFADFQLYLEIPELGEAGGRPDAKAEKTDIPKNWIPIRSFGLTVENPPTIGSRSGGAGTGKAKLSSIVVVKDFDGNSPVLFQALCTGGHYQTAKIIAVNVSGTAAKKSTEILSQIELTMVFISKIEIGGNARVGDAPTESITLAAGAIKITAFTPSGDGKTPPKPTEGTWDFTTNQK